MNQIIFIHGGETFESREKYYDFLEKKSYDPFKQKKRYHREFKGLENFEIIKPEMPQKLNADYKSWKIWFEKIFPYIRTEKLILIGGSLGGVFLAKYLSENTFPKKIDQLHMVAAPFEREWWGSESLASFGINDFENLTNITNKTEKIFIYHSKDDSVVPYAHAEKYLEYLPSAQLNAFEDRGHFLQEEFPELIENIKNNI